MRGIRAIEMPMGEMLPYEENYCLECGATLLGGARFCETGCHGLYFSRFRCAEKALVTIREVLKYREANGVLECR